MQRRGGIVRLQVDGEVYQVVGEWTRNLGRGMREALVGSDEVHGYKETPQTPFLEGVIRDRGDLDLDRLMRLDSATITMELPNGKVFVLYNAWFAGEGSITSDEGAVAVRFEGLSAEEITQ
jgi:hypothetical protein